MTNPAELSTRFDPGQFEERWYRFWLENNYFHAGNHDSRSVFSIVIPPPNVTGKLHMGHALVNTLQDVMIRYRRMQGRNTLWLPGTDHAGIATQMVVERELIKAGKSRHDLGREDFLSVMWDWKQKYKDNIKNQLMMLGCSCDWERERFTLDEGLSRAVRHVFVKLHQDGLLYRGRKIVNWCPRCQTALSDLEVEHQEVKGKLYHIAYPLEEGAASLILATTRPETLLGDTAVAVHPDDERYAGLIGQRVKLPLMNRSIPIVGDSMVDREFGTGVVKITPSHDPNDFEVAQRHHLPELTVMDERGVMNEEAGPYRGLDRFEARRAVLRDLSSQGLLKGEKDHLHAVGHCQRCQTMVEPYLSPQWYVHMKPLAEPAIDAVERGDLNFVPETWVKTYYEWMNNIHDWCISRQIWWGHRIPVFTCGPCGHVMVSETTPDSCEACGSRVLTQDDDVLDTWFSSALWPFSTMGWPEDTEDLRVFYPTTCLITGFDILFFWVARMIMMGLYCTGKLPFREVYLNALVRDARGQKMSKTRGNALEPETMCREFGADAVRFTLNILASPGRDIPLAPERMEGYKAFITKLWNAARFVMMKAPERKRLDGKPSPLPAKWILSRFQTLTKEVTSALDSYRFDQAAHALYHFLWHEYCDWFIELSKPYLQGELGSEKEQSDTVAVLYDVLDGTLRLLHPFMPFVTEEIWQAIKVSGETIVLAPFPEADETCHDPQAEEAMNWFIETIARIRSFRAAMSLPTATPLDMEVSSSGQGMVDGLGGLISQMAGLHRLTVVSETPSGLTDHVGGVVIGLKIPREILTRELKTRLEKDIVSMRGQLESLNRRLSDESFLTRAPAEIVEKQRQKVQELTERLNLMVENLGDDA
ncbi:MAG TPA: valine--tRNA ligase [Thermoanaerobaculia bacterium]|nr:valine--tRNA ligase [Thermoanaerobaculia bacterium]HUM28745.1 valine--tRNA ligase [Thermoanaerobaculia bacterium]HXK68005.1 valine--tRNA ligase [Thermoanaerobaculia bacterium]